MHPANLNDAQWQVMKEFIPDIERKRKYQLRSIWNALLYIVETECQWRMLPKEFPQWQIVYYYCNKWKEQGIIEFIMDKIREHECVKNYEKIHNPV
jgi:transposase